MVVANLLLEKLPNILDLAVHLVNIVSLMGSFQDTLLLALGGLVTYVTLVTAPSQLELLIWDCFGFGIGFRGKGIRTKPENYDLGAKPCYRGI